MGALGRAKARQVSPRTRHHYKARDNSVPHKQNLGQCNMHRKAKKRRVADVVSRDDTSVTSSPFSVCDYDEHRFKEIDEVGFDFLCAPYKLEKVVLLGMWVCWDSFLFMLTLYPIRIVLSFYLVLRSLFDKSVKFKLAHIVDIVQTILLVTSFYLVKIFVDNELVYDIVKNESLVKLKLLFLLLEIMDRLMICYGERILGSLYYGADSLFVSKNGDMSYLDFSYYFVVSVLYTGLHSMFLFFYFSVYYVAANSSTNSLITLLLLVQFTEMKGGVLKKYDPKSLLKSVKSDILERFHMVLFLTLVVLHQWCASANPNVYYVIYKINISIPRVLNTVMLIYFSELVVDCIKHTSTIMYNDIPSQVYTDYIDLFCDELKSANRHVLSDHSGRLASKFGFFHLPVTCVVFRVIARCLKHFSGWQVVMIMGLLYSFLMVVKIFGNMALFRFVNWRSQFSNNSSTNPELRSRSMSFQ